MWIYKPKLLNILVKFILNRRNYSHSQLVKESTEYNIFKYKGWCLPFSSASTYTKQCSEWQMSVNETMPAFL